MPSDVRIIDGRRTLTVSYGAGGPHILWACQAMGTNDADKLASKAYEACGGLPFTLTAFEVESWNDDLSPWKACLPERSGDFGGSAMQTLEWMRHHLIPQCESAPYVLGYSLAGLFSLWSLTQCEALAGAASCSGSTWYPGWNEYAASACWPRDSVVYLSLGSKEEQTENETMSKVGENTRLLKDDLKRNPSIKACVLEMNRGGHFSDPLGRLAKAIAWIVKRNGKNADI